MWKFSLREEDDFEGPSSPRTKKQRPTPTEEQEQHEEEDDGEEEGIQFEYEEEVESEHGEEEEEEEEEEGGGEEEEEEEEEDEGTRAGQASDRGSVGPNRDGSVSVTLTDPDVFDCPICFETLTVPVFQCENGHVSCASCCMKIRNKCPSCCLPIGYNRCRAIEKVLESAKVSCRNMKYGCKETVSYSKKHEHDKKCIYEPFLCPYPKCNYVGSSKLLSLHFRQEHSIAPKSFCFDSLFHISIGMKQKCFILQEQNEGITFILDNRTENLGNVVNVSYFGPSSSKLEFSYDLRARNGGSTVGLQTSAERISKWVEHLPLKRFLLVPSDFIDSDGHLKLELRILKNH